MQALSSACAKMCVRELRTENPSVSVFYLSWVTSTAAAIAIFIQIAIGKPVGKAIPLPGTFLDWALFLAIGEATLAQLTDGAVCMRVLHFDPKIS